MWPYPSGITPVPRPRDLARGTSPRDPTSRVEVAAQSTALTKYRSSYTSELFGIPTFTQSITITDNNLTLKASNYN